MWSVVSRSRALVRSGMATAGGIVGLAGFRSAHGMTVLSAGGTVSRLMTLSKTWWTRGPGKPSAVLRATEGDRIPGGSSAPVLRVMAWFGNVELCAGSGSCGARASLVHPMVSRPCDRRARRQRARPDRSCYVLQKLKRGVRRSVASSAPDLHRRLDPDLEGRSQALRLDLNRRPDPRIGCRYCARIQRCSSSRRALSSRIASISSGSTPRSTAR
jgi:hypothetical protein